MSSIDLIFLQNSNLGRESFFQESGVRIPAGEGEIFWHFSFFLPFSFSPQITEYQSIKDFCISTGYICLIYVPIFTDINLVKEDIIFSFLWRLWKWKENGTNKFDLPNGHLNPGFLNKFPPMIWILREIRSIKLMILKKYRPYNNDVYMHKKIKHAPS